MAEVDDIVLEWSTPQEEIESAAGYSPTIEAVGGVTVAVEAVAGISEPED